MSEVEVADDLPLLGESLALDAVNSRYGVPPDPVIDFLGDDWVARWIDGVVAVHQLPMSSAAAADRDAVRELRAVRDAVWKVVHAQIDGVRPPARAISIVNGAAASAPTVRTLGWGPTGPRPASRMVGDDAPLAGRFAASAIELLLSADAGRIRRCARPGCSMLFVPHHGHRRFCHPSCSHAMRQDRYRHRVRP